MPLLIRAPLACVKLPIRGKIMRENIACRTTDGVLLRGWYYPAAPAPVVVMAHGFSAVKEMYLDRYAEAFAAGGGVVQPSPPAAT